MAIFSDRQTLFLWLLLAHTANGFGDVPTITQMQPKVLVTGAAGRTGVLVFNSLEEDSRYTPIAMVRTESSAKKFIKVTKCALDQVVVSDITEMDINKKETLPRGLDGTYAMIICTSSTPFLSKTSLVKALCKVPFNVLRRRKALDFRSLRFKFRKGQYPEKVDFEGQKVQIDLAKKLGLKHVVIVSSMGGTDPNNFLNSVGKKADGTGNGDILLWKRKAERYLVESGLHYTIIHPAGLVDTPPGKEEYVLDVNDKLFESSKRTIGRADVANLCVAALAFDEDMSFDCITKVPLDSKPTGHSAESAIASFLKSGKTTDYS